MLIPPMIYRFLLFSCSTVTFSNWYFFYSSQLVCFPAISPLLYPVLLLILLSSSTFSFLPAALLYWATPLCGIDFCNTLTRFKKGVKKKITKELI